LESVESAFAEVFTPLADGMPVAVQLVGDGLVGGIAFRSAQDAAAAQGQRLRGGAGAREGFELRAVFDGQFDSGSPRVGHGRSPAAQTLVKSD
jgi:hypothetical protein